MDELTKRLKDSNDALQSSLDEMQKALDAFLMGRGVIQYANRDGRQRGRCRSKQAGITHSRSVR